MVFAVWRAIQLVLSWAFGARAGDAAFLWDAQAYSRIIGRGYHNGGGADRSITRFFPALSWLTKGVSFVTPSTRFAELLTANVIALLAFLAVFGVARAWKDDLVARRAVLLLAVFPVSLFLWAFYTEGLFIALGAGAYWADTRNRRWVAAGLLAGVATTRIPGILVAAVLVVAHLARERRLTKVSVLYACAGAAGLGAVMLQMYLQMGDALSFVSAQADFGNRKFAPPWTSIREGLGALKDADPRPARIVDLLALAMVFACVLFAARGRPTRWPLQAWLLPIAVVGLALCTPYLTGMSRFVMAAWPTFVIGGDLIGHVPRVVRIGVYVTSAVFAVFLAKYWAHGNFIA
jgi:hypothetical protein